MARKRSWTKCICKQCGKEFEVVPYKVRKGGGKFCSQQCYQKWNRGANRYNWNSLVRNCEICGKEFVARHSQAIRGKGRFCSRPCQSIWQSKTKKGRDKPKQSKRNKPQKKKAEQRATHRKAASTGESKSNPHLAERVSKICEQCGKEFTIIPGEAKRGGGRFCSRECVHQYQRGSNHPQWRGGETKRPSAQKKYLGRKPKDRKNRPGLVYLLLADNGLYKIGRTKSLQKRITYLGILLPYALELEMVILADDMYWLESELHRRFAENRVRGEWFQLDRDDLECIRKFALGMPN